MSRPPRKSDGPKRRPFSHGPKGSGPRDASRDGERRSTARSGDTRRAAREDDASTRGYHAPARNKAADSKARRDAARAHDTQNPRESRRPNRDGTGPERGKEPFGKRTSPRGETPGKRTARPRDTDPQSRRPARAEPDPEQLALRNGDRAPWHTPAHKPDSKTDPKAGFSRRDHPARADRSRNAAPGATTSNAMRGAGAAFARPQREATARPSVRPDLRTAPHKTARPTGPTPKNPDLPVREGERIAKLLARAGVASRRDAERLIADGRVTRAGEVISAPSTVLTDLTGVCVDGVPVSEPEDTRLFVFHKPGGLLTAERDPMGRPTIYTALRNALPEGTGRVIPVGRLDYNTEGLLLLTNDGAFKRQLELPSSAVPRTYRARAFGDITQPQLEELIEGIEIDGVHYGKIDANMERRTGRNQWIEMTLTEGKNREVRRVLEHLGLEVSRLIRVAYGPFVLADLPKGLAYEVPSAALARFRKSLESGQ